MFDELLPPLYLQLRIKSGLSKTKLATQLGVSRQTVANYESGHTRPDADYVRRLIEVSGCSLLEIARMFCELLGELIERPVMVLEPREPEPEEPHCVLERADLTGRELKRFIPPSMFRALANKVHITRMMQLTLERQTADLDELATDCRAAAGPHAPRRILSGITTKGATGPLASGPALDNRSVGTPSARPQSKPKPKQAKGNA